MDFAICVYKILETTWKSTSWECIFSTFRSIFTIFDQSTTVSICLFLLEQRTLRINNSFLSFIQFIFYSFGTSAKNRDISNKTKQWQMATKPVYVVQIISDMTAYFVWPACILYNTRYSTRNKYFTKCAYFVYCISLYLMHFRHCLNHIYRCVFLEVFTHKKI